MDDDASALLRPGPGSCALESGAPRSASLYSADDLRNRLGQIDHDNERELSLCARSCTTDSCKSPGQGTRENGGKEDAEDTEGQSEACEKEMTR